MNEQRNKMSVQEKTVKDIMNNCLFIQNGEQAINNILSELGKYYYGDRSYVFETDGTETHFTYTWEWYGEGEISKGENRRNLPVDELEPLLDLFKEPGEIYIYFLFNC